MSRSNTLTSAPLPGRSHPQLHSLAAKPTTAKARLLLGLLCALPTISMALDLGPRPEFPPSDTDRVRLGQQLFYDPILSGNQNISCATCHHPNFGTADAVSLAIGEGGKGLGRERQFGPDNRPEQRIPRNAPALWNLGATEFDTFFHDGRLESDSSQANGIRTPLGADMSRGFQSALAAQAMFPVLSPDEMAGHYSENDVSRAVRLGMLSQPGGAWDLIAARVLDIPAYAQAFEQSAPGEKITFAAVANMIADFIAHEWRADNSLFDRIMLAKAELPARAQQGMDLFYGKAQCSTCHSGWFQSDHDFHAIALPQIGPGKAARFESHARDEGRMRVTGDADDAFKFRTPSLRNVTLTAPYGHNGAFAKLRDMVQHHLDPVASLRRYDIELSLLPDFPGAQDQRILADPAAIDAIAAANELTPMTLDAAEIEQIIAFLGALEDAPERLGVPTEVPSGLAVEQ